MYYLTNPTLFFAVFLLSRLQVPGSLSMAGESNCITVTSEQLDKQHAATPDPARHQYIQHAAISSQQQEKGIRTTNPQHRQYLTYFLTYLLPSLLNSVFT